MLDRVKLYHATTFRIADGFVEIEGKNMSSNVEGEFIYPLHNVEHINIIDDKDQVVLVKEEEDQNGN